jgi:hypothetical protein
MNYNDEIPELDAAGLRKVGLETGGLVVAIFAVGFPLLFRGVAALTPPYTTGQMAAFGIGAVLILWALVAPAGLRRPYRGWMRVAMLIGSVVSRIVLGFVFYFVVLPTGLIMRALGNDPMRRKRDPEAASYRVVRSKQIRPSDMERPF